MNLKEELKQWLLNYELLLIDMRAAYRFKNKEAIDDLGQRILNTQVQIAMCNRALEKVSNANPNSGVGTSVSGDVEVRKNSSMYLERINRLLRRK